jgi:integrase
LRAVWLASDPSTDYGAIIRVLLLTGQRREEVGGMRWGELDLDRAKWTLPPERTKNGRPHHVPLSRQAVSILAVRPRLDSREAVFGRSDGKGFSGWSKCKQRLDAEVMLAKPWVVHDLRRSVVTGMAEIGVAPHVIEAIVNHVSGHKGGVAGIYNRATLMPERTVALQRWADHLESLLARDQAGNVATFFRS